MRDEAVHALLLAEQLRLEPHRFACEARFVLTLDCQRLSAYLAGVGKQRGAAAGEALRDEVVAMQSRAVTA